MRVGFLFNHDALHQVGHTAPVIAELARMPDTNVVVLTSSAQQEARVRALIGDAAMRVEFAALAVGPVAAALERILRGVAPFRRIAVLRENLALFAALDALVVPETTSLLLRDRFGLDTLRFVWIPHGAGDRSVGFRAVSRGFDLVLLSGRKVRDRMLAMGLVTPATHAIVGYPKFDTVDPAAPLPDPFGNGRPTVLYNPHFDPLLSSWYDMGEAVIDWFAAQDRFNLVVAPHVMLFRRRIHASVEHRRIRWRRDLPERFRGLPHVRIDTGSEASVNMSHVRAAAIYLGDASSQIYEWIARPRPAIFLNSGGHAWQGKADFAHWTLGQVVRDLPSLGAALDRAMADPRRDDAIQARAFAETFDRTDVPASRRAAQAIVDRAPLWLSRRSSEQEQR